LPHGVAPCKGLLRASWNIKCVTLTNESGHEVTKRICQIVDADLVIDTDGKPLGDDRLAVQIAKSGEFSNVSIERRAKSEERSFELF